MDSQKNENLLNLALDTPELEREKSLELNVGFDTIEKTWEVIVKYHGSLQELTRRGIIVEELIAGYAILTVPESEMDILTVTEQIEYVEKPKRLFFSDLAGNSASCYAPGGQRLPQATGSRRSGWFPVSIQLDTERRWQVLLPEAVVRVGRPMQVQQGRATC